MTALSESSIGVLGDGPAMSETFGVDEELSNCKGAAPEVEPEWTMG